MADPTPTIAEREATLQDALDLSQTVLIGIFSGPDERRALLRAPNGRVRKISVGDRVMRGRVLRIDEDGLMIVRGARVVRLPLAGQG